MREDEGITWHSSYTASFTVLLTTIAIFAPSVAMVLDILGHPLNENPQLLLLTIWIPYVLLFTLVLYLLASFYVALCRIPVRIGISKKSLHIEHLVGEPRQLLWEDIKDVSSQEGLFGRIDILTAKERRLRLITSNKRIRELIVNSRLWEN